MEVVSDVSSSVECLSWKLDVVPVRELIVTVAVGNRLFAMAKQSNGELLTALWPGPAALRWQMCLMNIVTGQIWWGTMCLGTCEGCTPLCYPTADTY